MTIVVLGAGITKKGNLPEQAKKRLDKALKMLKRRKEANVLLCGKYSFLYPKSKLPPTTEAEAMRDYLLKKGVDEDKIYLEKKSKDTVGNAYYAKKEYFIPKKEKEALVVTSDFFLERVKFIFEKIFGPTYKLKFYPVTSPIKDKEKKKRIKKRQKYLLHRTKQMLKDMIPGHYNFLKNKIYKLKYYKEKRPNWVKKFVTEGK